MDLLKKCIIKKGKGLKIKKNSNYIEIVNTSSNRGYVIILKPIFAKNKSIFFDSNVDGEGCYFKFIDRKLNIF